MSSVRKPRPSFDAGYQGQRYEVVALRPPGDSPAGRPTEKFIVGWTDLEDGGGLVRGVKVHPSWRDPVVVDLGEDKWKRQPGKGLLAKVEA